VTAASAIADRSGGRQPGALVRAAAVAPVALKTNLYERVWSRLLRRSGVPADQLIETNLGIDSRLRCQIPAFKANYLFGRPDTSVAERASLKLAQILAADCPHFIDVGANEGIYTFLAHCAVTPRPTLHWFEPDDGLFGRACRNLAANGVEAFGNQVAVSAKTGTAEFFKNLSDDASGSLTDYFADKHVVRGETVPTVALADYFHEHRVEDAFLKIDVEGHGFSAWQGAAPAADKVRYLLAEVLAPEMSEGLPQTLIRDHGFFAYYVRDFDLVQSRAGEFEYHEPHWNWLFCRLPPEALATRLAHTPFRVTAATGLAGPPTSGDGHGV
jgi:FkbM family methyltransferase